MVPKQTLIYSAVTFTIVHFNSNLHNGKRYSHADFAAGSSWSRLPTESCFAGISLVGLHLLGCLPSFHEQNPVFQIGIHTMVKVLPIQIRLNTQIWCVYRITDSFFVKFDHSVIIPLPLFAKFSWTKSSYFYRNLHNLEFCVRVED